MSSKPVLCVVGLGYVGLPLAAAFARKGYDVHGFDISEDRIRELKEGMDRTKELTREQLQAAPIRFSADPAVIGMADIIILAIPTPVDDSNNPDLTLVEKASETTGKYLKKGSIVVYESTVYPGVTEDICGPILEKASGLTCGVDFTLGYSPERINPGDKEHTVDRIVKVVAGQDERTLHVLSELYNSIVTAGIYRASSIKVAEMAKAIENAQRDINIAFVNEIAMLCNALDIPTHDVLKAAGSKWNFLKFQPGLVGGHCIGVDPYYLVEAARQKGMQTQVIAAGRAINDSMAAYVAERVLEKLPAGAKDAKVLIMGVTFKENVPDMRNSHVRAVAEKLSSAGAVVQAHDAEVSALEFQRLGYERGSLDDGPFDAILLLVPHKEYLGYSFDHFRKALRPGGVFFDLKSLHGSQEWGRLGYTYIAL